MTERGPRQAARCHWPGRVSRAGESTPQAPTSRSRPKGVRNGLLVSVLLLSCQRGQSPEDTVRAFLRAAAGGERDKIFALLSPEDQRALADQARLATAQAGGGRRFEPQDLLASSLTKSEHDAAQIEPVSQQSDRAKVRVRSAKGVAEIWQLLRIKGRWRVVLPKAAPSTSATADAEATAVPDLGPVPDAGQAGNPAPG